MPKIEYTVKGPNISCIRVVFFVAESWTADERSQMREVTIKGQIQYVHLIASTASL